MSVNLWNKIKELDRDLERQSAAFSESSSVEYRPYNNPQTQETPLASKVVNERTTFDGRAGDTIIPKSSSALSCSSFSS